MILPRWIRDLCNDMATEGIKIDDVVLGGKHLKLFLPNGRRVFCSSTPSDWRTVLNVKAEIRREAGKPPRDV